MTLEVGSCSFGRFHILSREDGDEDIREAIVGQTQRQTGSGIAGSTPTNRVHEGQNGPLSIGQKLIDLLPDELVLRGDVAEVGTVRRTVPIGTKLYAITDKTIGVVDVSDRDAPTNSVILVIGDQDAPDCEWTGWNDGGDESDDDTVVGEGCQLAAPSSGGAPAPLSLLAFLLLAVLVRARGRGQP